MNTGDFESMLYKLSVDAIYSISNGAKDVITIQEAIERNAYFRAKLGCVQIWSISFDNSENYCDIQFLLSPDFMMENSSLTLKSRLYNLSWTFSIKRYDYEDDEDQKVYEEDGVDGWLIKSEIIGINYEKIDIKNIKLSAFAVAIQNTDSF